MREWKRKNAFVDDLNRKLVNKQMQPINGNPLKVRLWDEIEDENEIKNDCWIGKDKIKKKIKREFKSEKIKNSSSNDVNKIDRKRNKNIHSISAIYLSYVHSNAIFHSVYALKSRVDSYLHSVERNVIESNVFVMEAQMWFWTWATLNRTQGVVKFIKKNL